jgi:hypothetical protein
MRLARHGPETVPAADVSWNAPALLVAVAAVPGLISEFTRLRTTDELTACFIETRHSGRCVLALGGLGAHLSK